MRKIILNLAVSLDGLIEGPNGEFDWCFTDQDYGMTEFLDRTDALFIGRKSYDLMLQYEPDPYPDKMKYVLSNTLQTAAGKTAIVGGDIVETARAIKSQSGGDIWLYGGAEITTIFLNAGLVDELQLAVHPLLLGSGKPLFKDLEGRMPWKLADAKTYDSGLVQLFYQKD
jgi:dihydrofolate reductase